MCMFLCDDTKYDAAKQINLLERTSIWPIKNIKTLFIPNPNSKNVRGWHIRYGFVANNITKTMND